MNARLYMKRIQRKLKADMEEQRKADRIEWITIIFAGVIGSALVWWGKYLGG